MWSWTAYIGVQRCAAARSEFPTLPMQPTKFNVMTRIPMYHDSYVVLCMYTGMARARYYTIYDGMMCLHNTTGHRAYQRLGGPSRTQSSRWCGQDAREAGQILPPLHWLVGLPAVLGPRPLGPVYHTGAPSYLD